MLAGIEYIIATCLIVFLFSLNLIDETQFPSWIPFYFRTVSPVALWVILVFIGLLQAAGYLFNNQTRHILVELIRARLKMILGYEMLMVDQEQPIPLSKINLRMTEFFPKAADFIFHSTEFIFIGNQVLFLFLGMLYLAWREAVIGMLFLCSSGFILLWINKLLLQVSKKIPEQQASLERTIVRIVRNALLIKIFGLRDREYRIYLTSVVSYFRYSTKAAFFANIAGILPPFIGVIAIGVIIYASFHYFETPAVNLLGFLYLFVRFTQLAGGVAKNVGLMSSYSVHFKESVKLFSSLSPADLSAALSSEQALHLFRSSKNLPDIASVTSGDYSTNSISKKSPPAIRVCNITFSWSGVERPVFEGLSLDIDAGSQFGIIGPNGSGKSTLLGNILGTLTPSSGNVFIEDIESKEYLRNHYDTIGYVSDEPYLIYGTIRENLFLGTNKNVSDNELWDSLEMVKFDTVIRGLPGGMDYVIQENEDGLSSGQKQRLSLARAFLRKPLLLVLDEASANLDKKSESLIADALKELKGCCTVIIVSHKPGILKGADAILDLNTKQSGKMEES